MFTVPMERMRPCRLACMTQAAGRLLPATCCYPACDAASAPRCCPLLLLPVLRIACRGALLPACLLP